MSVWFATPNRSPSRQGSARRELLKRGGLWLVLANCGLVGAREALAALSPSAFDASTMQEALDALGSIEPLGGEIVLSIPALAPDGAVVPVSVDSRLPDTEEIFILVEANPNPLAVRFGIPAGTEPFVSTRIRMAGTSRVHAVVRSAGKLYGVSCETQVLRGGCGG